MMLRPFIRATRVALLAVVACAVPCVHATESRADLGVTLRLIQTSPVHASGKTAGTARIEVTVDAFRETEIVSVDVVGPRGEPWGSRSGLRIPSSQAWTDATGRQVDTTSKEARVAARGLLKTFIEVPLEGAGVHDVVVRVVGRSGGQMLEAEDALRVPYGVPRLIQDDGTVANVPVKEVR